MTRRLYLMIVFAVIGCDSAAPPAPAPVEQTDTRPSHERHVNYKPKSRVEVESEKAGNIPQDIRASITAKVIGVTDGDTIKVIRESDLVTFNLRLKHIDAPEKAQAFGDKAKQALREKLIKKTVYFTTDEMDKYGRALADVRLDGELINLWLVSEGWAWHYKRFSNDSEYAQAEVLARSERRGLWADNGVPLAPWEWRNPPDEPGLFCQGNGTKYHTGKCPNLDSRRRLVEDGEIDERGLEPCKVCHPVLDSTDRASR